MVKKYAVLIGIIISIGLLNVAAFVYPGGSLFDKKAVGFNWSKNFISNLLAEKAVNGAHNTARIWGDMGMFILSVSFAIFFVHFSHKIPAKGAAKIIKYLGMANIIFISLIVTPLHDIMVPLASTLFLICLFYISIFILKSGLKMFKVLCIICLLIFYYTFYVYGTGAWAWLSIMQKIAFAFSICLILGLEYFTKKEDFIPAKSGKVKESEGPDY